MSFQITASSNSQATASFNECTGQAEVDTKSTSTISGDGYIPGSVNASAKGDADASLQVGGLKLKSHDSSHVDYSKPMYWFLRA